MLQGDWEERCTGLAVVATLEEEEEDIMLATLVVEEEDMLLETLVEEEQDMVVVIL